jgi:hypothetical protein
MTKNMRPHTLHVSSVWLLVLLLADDNTFLISVMPDFQMNGQEDSVKWENILQFFILDKTDYSDPIHPRWGVCQQRRSVITVS